MKLLFELGMFGVIFSAALAVCAGTLWVVGSPFQLEFRDSIAFSFVSLVFMFPAVVNLWVLFRGSDGESIGERVLAGIRGFGMLLCAVTIFAGIATKSVPFAAGVPFLALGFLLLFGTVPIEMWIRHRQSNASSGADA